MSTGFFSASSKREKLRKERIISLLARISYFHRIYQRLSAEAIAILSVDVLIKYLVSKSVTDEIFGLLDARLGTPNSFVFPNMNRSILLLSKAVFNWVRYRSTVGAGLADNLCLQTHKLWSKPAPTVGAGLADNLCLQTHKLWSKPAPTKDVLHPLANCYKSNAWKHLQVLSLAVGILSLTACQSPPTQLQTQNLASLPRILSVSGRGDVTIPTTKTQVRLGVEVQGKTAQEVQQQVAQKSSAVVELLKSRQVEKLETTGVNLNPVYSYENSKQTLVGYSGSNIVNFRIETQKTGNLLDEAIKAGATRIDGISFVASSEAIAQAQQQAINEATQNAKKQADAALNTLNLKQQEIVGIQINAANPPVPPPRPYNAVAQVAKESAATPVIGGEQEIEASVTLQIRY